MSKKNVGQVKSRVHNSQPIHQNGKNEFFKRMVKRRKARKLRKVALHILKDILLLFVPFLVIIFVRYRVAGEPRIDFLRAEDIAFSVMLYMLNSYFFFREQTNNSVGGLILWGYALLAIIFFLISVAGVVADAQNTYAVNIDSIESMLLQMENTLHRMGRLGLLASIFAAICVIYSELLKLHLTRGKHIKVDIYEN